VSGLVREGGDGTDKQVDDELTILLLLDGEDLVRLVECGFWKSQGARLPSASPQCYGIKWMK
jgi:hypothetical protein